MSLESHGALKAGNMEFKFIIFWCTLLIGVPFGVLVSRFNKNAIHVFFFAMILSMNESERFGINFMSRQDYRTITRGFEFTIVDILAIIVFLSMLLRPAEFKLKLLPPLFIVNLFYLLTMIIPWLYLESSTLPVPGVRFLDDYTIYPPDYEFFEVALYPLFEFSKIARGLFIFWVAYNYFTNTKNYDMLIYCSAGSILYSTGLVLQQRYLHGVVRVYAHLGHANSLATFTGMHAMIVLVAAVRSKRFLTSFLFFMTSICAVMIVMMTVSRGGLAILLLGYFCIAIFTIRNYLNSRNVMYMAGAVLVLFLMTLIAFDTLKQRFFQDAVADYQYRNDYNIEALLMVKDHPLGVGGGNFSAFSWYEYGELANERNIPGTPAHNFLLLNLAELGYLGLAAFLLIWCRFFSLLHGLKKRLNPSVLDKSLIFSAGIAILAMLFQELLNFSYRQLPVLLTVMYLCAMVSSIYNDYKNQSVKE